MNWEVRKIAVAGSVGLVMAACGGRVEVLNSGQTGSGGTAGTSATPGGRGGNGVGGFVGKGGSFNASGSGNGASAGTGVAGTGAGGRPGMVPYACSVVVPPSEQITDFDGAGPDWTWGDPAGFYGGVFVYPSEPNVGAMLPTFNQNMTVSGTVSSYSGFGMWFGPCTDASRFDGVAFDISSNYGMAIALTFNVMTNGNTPIDPINMRGACAYGEPELMYSACVQPSFIMVVPPEPTTMRIEWSHLYGGIPHNVVNPGELLGLLWNFSWSDSAVPYPVDVTIDNLRFF